MLQQAKFDYGPFRKTSVIYNASAPETRARDKEQFILAVGRLWDKAKNIGALASVAPLVDWPILVAGDDSLEAAKKVDNGAAGVSARQPGSIESLGRLSGPETRERMSRAGIYAFPARYEPFGLSILEAANAGCALVLGDIESLRELWEGAALFVAPDDLDGLSAVIHNLSRDPIAREEWAEKARRRAERYDASSMLKAYLTLYEEMLSCSGGSSHEELAKWASAGKSGSSALIRNPNPKTQNIAAA
jgi:glycosyltransferase involved in cell wall biosynthesis